MKLSAMDLEISALGACEYDLAVYASGYEARSTRVARLLETIESLRTVVLGFEELADNEQREANDKYYYETRGVDPLIVPADNDTPVYASIRELVARSNAGVHLLVDYSSMSRLWYAAFLNWARYQRECPRIEIDFVYSIAEREVAVSDPGVSGPGVVIDEMRPVPGFEGSTPEREETVAVFGLGFYGLMTECVLEQLQADHVYAYMTDPAAYEDYPDRVEKANQKVIERCAALLRVPLTSVAATHRYLCELVRPYVDHANVTIVPMGPKPHVLAALLVSLTYPSVSCLRVSTMRKTSVKIEGSDAVMATRVAFDHEQQDGDVGPVT